jgi:hypothetical protein
MKRIIGLFTLILLLSCSTGRYEVPGNPQTNITIQRFDRAFYETGDYQDSAFLNLYANQIMEVGEPGSPLFKQFEKIFRKDDDIRQLYNDCQETFSDVSDIEEELTWGFYRLHYFFPKMPIPKVYMHIGAYGESIVSAPGILSAAIDKYLGKDYKVYHELFDSYQTQRMYPQKLPVDYVTGWVRSELTEESLLKDSRLLDYIAYEGKMLFLVKVLLPEESMENITGFTTDQLSWCAANEKNMWNTLLQRQQLYSKESTMVAKYLREAPYTYYFGTDSPGRAVTWIGYRMVDAYMAKHPKTSVQELLLKVEPAALLKGSEYNP